MVIKFKFLFTKQILKTESGILTTTCKVKHNGSPLGERGREVSWGLSSWERGGWVKKRSPLGLTRGFLLVFSPVAAILNTILTLIPILTQYCSLLRCLHTSLAPCHTVYTHIHVLAHAMHAHAHSTHVHQMPGCCSPPLPSFVLNTIQTS